MVSDLVHLEAQHGPVGSWRVCDGKIIAYYLRPHRRFETPARQLLESKGATVPWDVWFERLTRRFGYTANFVLYDPDGLSQNKALERLLADYASA